MQILTSSLDYGQFVAGIAAAPGRVLLLDYDGTLAPFHVDPAQARPYPEALRILNEIMRAGGTRVVIVSGRPAAEVAPLIGLQHRPEIWGTHGWERLQPDGTLEVEQPSVQERDALAQAARDIDPVLARGARLERKSASIALHWRGLSEADADWCRNAAYARWQPHAASTTLSLLQFDGGLELRAPGCNKQHAVKAVLSGTPAGAAIAYLGDDITDEDAFRAVKPRGVSVLVRPEFRATEADVWLQPPHELIAFLEHWRVPAH